MREHLRPAPPCTRPCIPKGDAWRFLVSGIDRVRVILFAVVADLDEDDWIMLLIQSTERSRILFDPMRREARHLHSSTSVVSTPTMEPDVVTDYFETR